MTRTLTRLLAAAAVGAALAACSVTAPPASTPTPPAGTSTPAAPSTQGVAWPVAVEVPAIGASSTLIRLGVDPDGTIAEPPETEPEQAGWYEHSPVPGQSGPAVILGHINGDGRPGVFVDLASIGPGDQVFVYLADGTRVAYTITRLQQVAKDDFPTAEVYGDTAGPEIRLISCGGVFDPDSGHYSDNLIAYGTQAELG